MTQDKHRKAFIKAIEKAKKLETAAEFAILQSRDENVASLVLRLTEYVVRYNGRASDFDHVLEDLLYSISNVMRDPEGE